MGKRRVRRVSNGTVVGGMGEEGGERPGLQLQIETRGRMAAGLKPAGTERCAFLEKGPRAKTRPHEHLIPRSDCLIPVWKEQPFE